jgi:hypothetical protein
MYNVGVDLKFYVGALQRLPSIKPPGPARTARCWTSKKHVWSNQM